MVRAEEYRKVQGYSVSPKLLRVEDYHLWFKMYAKGLIGYNLSEVYYKMRDDRNATARRNWTNRKNEMYVKWIGYRMLKLPLYVFPNIIIPLLKYLTPISIYNIFHRKG